VLEEVRHKNINKTEIKTNSCDDASAMDGGRRSGAVLAGGTTQNCFLFQFYYSFISLINISLYTVFQKIGNTLISFK